MTQLRIGIFFGGPSREREISFAGGRTVYDNLDKSLFEAVPIFVDSKKNFILLNWEYVYKGSIRDFYPPVSELPPSENEFQVYLESLGEISPEKEEKIINKVGKRLKPSDLSALIDVAFLSLHGAYGEDGQLQGMMESLDIPYTGSGVRACSIGIDKSFQKKLMALGDFPCPKVEIVERKNWSEETVDHFFEKAKKEILFPLVIRPANQGSSIGVAILNEANKAEFEKAIDIAFFIHKIDVRDFQNLKKEAQLSFLVDLTDIRSGIGFPLDYLEKGQAQKTLYHPEELLSLLRNAKAEKVKLSGHQTEKTVIIEAFISGKEFSTIVLKKEDSSVTSLPPTEIVKGSEVFDYRSKYLPGLSRKVTPIDLPNEAIEKIRSECVRLFDYLEFQTYARIDGFYTEEGTVFLNDPNTTSGMLPSSFFFHQAAEIGLNPSQFLTYIIRVSLQERISKQLDINHFSVLLKVLDEKIEQLSEQSSQKKRIGVILGGYSFERHISVESGRNIFEKLSSSEKYIPVPIFLTGSSKNLSLYQLPINLLLKDNADDICEKILNFKIHPVLGTIRKECEDITKKYGAGAAVFEPKEVDFKDLAEMVDGVFIALHGRPGEDGELQEELEKVGLPYNGSRQNSCSITIDKYKTLQILKKEGFLVTDQALLSKSDFEKNKATALEDLLQNFSFPFIVKPVDDGCSSAVKVIKDQTTFEVFLSTLFRETENIDIATRDILGLSHNEEFPRKNVALIEKLISKEGAKHFLEVTGGLRTYFEGDELKYQIFEPSESLATGEVLSLEEKFLAGEGQNITPARYDNDPVRSAALSQKVKADLLKVAQTLKVTGYARIDAFVRVFEDDRVETIVIEINSLPGMTPATCIFHQTALEGMKPIDFIDKILEYGFERQERASK